MRVIPLCVACVFLFVFQARADWFKLGIAAQMSSGTQSLDTYGPLPLSTNFASVAGFFTFDTDAAPTASTDTTVTFGVGEHEISVTTMVAGATVQRVFDPANSAARIEYDGSSDALSFFLTADDDGVPISFRFDLVQPAGEFTVDMQSLPTSGYGAQGSVFAVLNAGPNPFQAIYLRSANRFLTGAVQYILGGTPAPQPRPCSPADLAAPFGILNFFDLTDFLDLLSQSCP
jgi:hypothetical protein